MGNLLQISELSRKRRLAIRARSRTKQRGRSQGALDEYRGRESYEQQSPEGRGGQSGMFDQTDYPPRQQTHGDEPAKDDGQLLTPEDHMPSTPPAGPEDVEDEAPTTKARRPTSART